MIAFTDIEIGETIRQLRKLRGLSQQTLAECVAALIGTDFRQQAVFRVERGLRPLRFSEALALAEVLGVPISGLFQSNAVASKAALENLRVAKERLAAAEAAQERDRRRVPSGEIAVQRRCKFSGGCVMNAEKIHRQQHQTTPRRQRLHARSVSF